MRELTITEARNFILAKQGLLGAHRFVGKQGALEYVRQAGCIQYDPVDACGKNAELTLQSRVKGFQKKMLQELLYVDRALVDYSDKELAIFPVENWPYFSGYRARSLTHGSSFAGLAELEEQALGYIREHGPVSSDTLPIEGKIFWHSSMHWSGNWEKDSQAARSVLEQLYTDGVLVIHHKEGSRKYYDLASRQLPASLLEAENPCREEMEFLCWRILHRIGAVGLLWNRRSDALLGIAMTTQQRNEAFARLLGEQRIEEVSIAGLPWPFYFLREDRKLLDEVQSGGFDDKARCEFLAPLDPLLWDRKLIEVIFDYRYTWEIYTPVSKRKYGHYVLPVLYGNRLVGRLEATADRKNQVLVLKHVWYEDGVRQTKKLKRAIWQGVRRLARLNGCGRIEDQCLLTEAEG